MVLPILLRVEKLADLPYVPLSNANPVARDRRPSGQGGDVQGRSNYQEMNTERNAKKRRYRINSFRST